MAVSERKENNHNSTEKRIQLEIVRQGYLPNEVYELIAPIVSLEVKIDEPNPVRRLSTGARIHIRKLKSQGKVTEAEIAKREDIDRRVRLNEEEVRRIRSSHAMLVEVSTSILSKTQDESIPLPDKRVNEVVNGIKAVWLANAVGIIGEVTRQELVAKIYDLNLAYEEKIEPKWDEARQSIRQLMPKK